MTVQFSSSFNDMFFYLSIVRPITVGSGVSILLYKGVQPKADDVQTNWSTYNAASGNLLWYSNGSRTSVRFDPATMSIGLSTAFTSAVPISDGIATWAMIISDHTQTFLNSIVSSNTLTTSNLPAGYFLVPVTDRTGQGVVRLENTTINVANGSMTISDFGIKPH